MNQRISEDQKETKEMINEEENEFGDVLDLNLVFI